MNQVDHDCTDRLAVRILLILQSRMLSCRLDLECLATPLVMAALVDEGALIEGCALANAAAYGEIGTEETMTTVDTTWKT